MNEETQAIRELMEGYITAGVKVTEITDDGKVIFSVPSMNDLSLQDGAMLSGQILLEVASEMFLQNGLNPEGSIRDEYWTSSMADDAYRQFKGIPCLL